jgi:hypothetical protein
VPVTKTLMPVPEHVASVVLVIVAFGAPVVMVTCAPLADVGMLCAQSGV